MSLEDEALPYIRAQSLCKEYRSGPEVVMPLNDLDLTLPKSSVTALIGPSGSGKSTLLSCLAGIEAVDGGQLWIGDTEVSALNPRKRDRWRAQQVGLVFQAFHLIQVLDARTNVLLGLAGRRPKAADRHRAEDLLQRVGLADRARHRPDQLSGGQQQRVAIARALIHRPPLILADEPTGNLDAKGARSITELLVSMTRDEGATVVIVTHDERVAEVCDAVFYLDAGRIVEHRASLSSTAAQS